MRCGELHCRIFDKCSRIQNKYIHTRIIGSTICVIRMYILLYERVSIFLIMTSLDLHVHFDLFMLERQYTQGSIHIVFGSYCIPDPQHVPCASLLICEVACRDIVSQHLAFAHTFALLQRNASSILYHYEASVDDVRFNHIAIVADEVVDSLQMAFQEAWELHVGTGTALDVDHLNDPVARECGEKFFRDLAALALIPARIAWNNDLSTARAALSKGAADVRRLEDIEDAFVEALERRGLPAADIKGWLMPMIADLRLSIPPTLKEYEDLVEGLFEM